MQKNLQISVLLDYYGDMLTPKQKEVVELYYNEDLSLAEISQLSNITRQGVRDSIKRGETTLLEMEERLGLIGMLNSMRANLSRVGALARDIIAYNDRYGGVAEISRLAGSIVELSKAFD